MENRLGLHEDPYTVRRHLLIALRRRVLAVIQGVRQTVAPSSLHAQTHPYFVLPLLEHLFDAVRCTLRLRKEQNNINNNKRELIFVLRGTKQK